MAKKLDKEIVDPITGELINDKPELGVMKEVVTFRPNGTMRLQYDFSAVPSLTDPTQAHMTDLNYLIATYKPDELAAYIAARSKHRQEIMGHDFASEPSMQDAMNVVADSKRNFEALPDDIRKNFKSHLEFLKFIDNPANEEKMIKLGIMTQKQVDQIKIKDTTEELTPTPTPTKEKEKAKESTK